jgi:23S rRNA pseudouridine955/2504/2580 synthase
MFLHAHTLALQHPVTQAPLSFKSPLPADLADFVARLDRDQADNDHA